MPGQFSKKVSTTSLLTAVLIAKNFAVDELLVKTSSNIFS